MMFDAAARHRLLTAEETLAFALAGRAIFTLVSAKTGSRFTFRVSRCKGESEDRPWFVSVLTGPDQYTYLGSIFPGSLRFNRGKKSPIGTDAASFRAFSWSWEAFRAGQMPTALEVWHEGRCGRCGRRLTVPASILSGLGPECQKAA